VTRPWFVLVAIVASASAAPKRGATIHSATIHIDEPAPAQLDDPCVESQTPCTRHALDGWRAALATQRAGSADHPLRVSYYGDSVTGDDHLTHALRKKLQALVGDGGAGFVFAAPPHPYCQHRAVARVVGDGWIVHGISTLYPPDRLLGLGGTAESDGGGGVIRLVPGGAASTVEVDYLAQPHGGKLEVVADGNVVETIATLGETKRGVFAPIALPPRTARIELRAHGRVRLFGVALEAARGAVVDNLGIINATAKAMRDHNLAAHWRDQLAHRAADLVVVMYGTNEAEWLRPRGAGIAEHERVLGELLATVRDADPRASCLVVSPLDQLDWRDEHLPPRASIPAMVEAQRRAAAAHGCAFWDAYAWMGGAGAARAWWKRGLLWKDFQHPTSEGAERIANALYAGLVP
jgi:lysophospholipase L1-like esterase